MSKIKKTAKKSSLLKAFTHAIGIVAALSSIVSGALYQYHLNETATIPAGSSGGSDIIAIYLLMASIACWIIWTILKFFNKK